jgi:transposase
VCADPFHVVKLANHALDEVRRAAWNHARRAGGIVRRPDDHLDAWLARACRCRIPAMVALSKTVRAHRPQILAAVELGLSNSKLEGLSSKIRLINHRGIGHLSVEPAHA